MPYHLHLIHLEKIKIIKMIVTAELNDESTQM